MSFHLPFYALRDASRGSTLPEAKGVRRSESIGFMRDFPQPNTRPSSSCEYIYQAKLSCLVTGHNCRVWSAYLFLDNYNDYEEYDIEDDYDPQKEVLEQACVTSDPFGGTPLARPQIPPRESFLKIFEVLSNQTRKEWCNTITHVVEMSDTTVCLFFLSFLSFLHPHYDGIELADLTNQRARYLKNLYSHGEEGRSRRQACALWISSVIQLLATLKRGLVECTNAWAIFSAPGGDIGYFHNPGKHWDMKKRDRIRLDIIKKNFTQMSSMLQKLDMIDNELMRITNEVSYVYF